MCEETNREKKREKHEMLKKWKWYVMEREKERIKNYIRMVIILLFGKY